MRILITGASGQIGANLGIRCVRDGHEVVGVDCRANDWTAAFPCLPCDLRAAASLAVPGARPDVVVHLAAHAKVHELVLDPRRAFENIAMTQNVLDYCRAAAVPIVFASSREVYGDACGADACEGDADFARAGSTYAASKIAGEALVYAYARCYGLPYLVFRLSNVYGRFDNDLARMQRVIPLFIRRIREGRPVTVYGVEKVIDFTYVDDCVDGIVSGIDRLESGHVRNQTVNLAFGAGRSLLQMAEYVGESVGRAPRILAAPARVGEVVRYVANLDRARALLDFAPRVDLREGIRRAVAWGQDWSLHRAADDASENTRQAAAPGGAASAAE